MRATQTGYTRLDGFMDRQKDTHTGRKDSTIQVGKQLRLI